MEKNRIKLYGNKFYGVEVSDYGLRKGYLDYKSLADVIGDCILNNTIRQVTYDEDWELISGEDCFGLDEDGRECDLYDLECVEYVPYEIYQDYIISEHGANFLSKYTNEIVYYNSELDIHIWGVTHFGTSWDYVLTDIKLVKVDE